MTDRRALVIFTVTCIVLKLNAQIQTLTTELLFTHTAQQKKLTLMRFLFFFLLATFFTFCFEATEGKLRACNLSNMSSADFFLLFFLLLPSPSVTLSPHSHLK